MRITTAPQGGLWGATRPGLPSRSSALSKTLLETLDSLPFKARQEFYRKHKKWILQELQSFRGR